VKTLSYVVILLLSLVVPVRAAMVYSGCAAPPSSFRQIWYVDPVNGKSPKDGGTGFRAAPWNSLNGILSGYWATAGWTFPGYTRPLLSTVPYLHIVNGVHVDVADSIGNPPVQPGDAIMLMSGNYGDIVIGAYQKEVANPSFVTVQAAPGQTPVLSTLLILSTTNWVFNGLKVQSLYTSANTRPLIYIHDQGASLPTANIVLENMMLSSQDDAEAWSQAQWIANARAGFYAWSDAGGTDTECISFTGSHISNVRTGASLAANKLIFSNNQIDHFGDDGIDYAASNLSITHNDIHDNLDVGDGNHMDAMQGVIGFLPAGATVNYLQNILIDSNLVIRQTDPELSFPAYLQGIDAFDSDWTNMTVTNNVIVTSSCWGIAFSSIHNSLIANNTVLADGLIATPGCTVWLQAGGKSHEGPDSSNTRVTNNLAEHFIVGNPNETTVTYDHNVALNSYQPFTHWVGTVESYGPTSAGTDANGNLTPAKPGFPYANQFVTWSPATLSFSLMLKAGSVAIGAGVAGAPTVDILGATRTAPYTGGAYSYPY
jgi:Right handed beta helix region